MACPHAIVIALLDHMLIPQMNAKNVYLHVRLVTQVNLV